LTAEILRQGGKSLQSSYRVERKKAPKREPRGIEAV